MEIPTIGEFSIEQFDYEGTSCDVILCRIAKENIRTELSNGLNIDGVVIMDDGSIVTCFSNDCPHMGCKILTENNNGVKLPNGALVHCPCHSSSFDMANCGMTVMGPATDWLPQVKLKKVDEENVELEGWISRTVGRGIPYGKTTTQATE